MICKQHSYNGKYPCPSCSSGEGETFMGEPAIQKTVPISRELIHQMHRAAGCSGNMTFDEVVKAALGRLLAQPAAGEPVAFGWPDYHGEAMGCGLEDRGITDRYEAMLYGWEEAAERYAEIALAEPLFRHPPAPAVPDLPAMARVLADRAADACNINRDDNWNLYGEEYLDDVRAMLAAAPQPTEGPTDE